MNDKIYRAKKRLKKWLNSVESNNGWKQFGPLKWRSCRITVFMNYPIVINKYISSLSINWDEILYNPRWQGKNIRIPYLNEEYKKYLKDNRIQWKGGKWNCWVPTEEECINCGLMPIDVIDIIIENKGHPKYGIKLFDKERMSNDKVYFYKEKTMLEVYEISADWILKQKEIPYNLHLLPLRDTLLMLCVKYVSKHMKYVDKRIKQLPKDIRKLVYACINRYYFPLG